MKKRIWVSDEVVGSRPQILELSCNSFNTLLELSPRERTYSLFFNRWQIQSANGVVSVTSKAMLLS
uniref:Uncharacterized protein n=1 Tax=Solanum lycopersicum TaxID=4081 RepID=A0A3Q7JAL1_SOLLC